MTPPFTKSSGKLAPSTNFRKKTETNGSGIVDDVLIIEPYVSLIIGIDSLTIHGWLIFP